MAGMVPKRRSRTEIERANQNLLDRNRAYMQRWLDLKSERSEQGDTPEGSSNDPSTPRSPRVDFR
jgi:hypothetical protein